MAGRMIAVGLPFLLLGAVALAAAAASCGSDRGTPPPQADATTPTDGPVADVTGADSPLTGRVDAAVYGCAGCAPFPPLPAPACAPAVLAAPAIVYPQDGTLLPPNLGALEVQFVPPPGATLFEVDFENSVTDVRVESRCVPVPDARGGASKGCGVSLTPDEWLAMSNKNRQFDPVTVTVRATIDGACVSTSTQTVNVSISERELTEGIVYWQGGASGKTGGVYVHDFTSADPTPIPVYKPGSAGTCVGCHSVSIDGQLMAVATGDPDGDDEMGELATSVIHLPSRAVFGGSAVSPGFQAWSPDHSRMIASSFKNSQNAGFDIFDDRGTLLANAPITGKATQPDLSLDGHTLLYVVPQSGTISTRGDHHFMGGSIYAAFFDPLANAIGSNSLVIHAPNSSIDDAGAGGRSYFYPAMSPTNGLVLFDDAPSGDAFYNKTARIRFLHYPTSAGDSPLDLPRLNGPAGVSSTWPRWSPNVEIYQRQGLVWVAFASNRDYGLHLTGNATLPSCYPPESPAYDVPQPLASDAGYEGCSVPQIWVAAVLVDGSRNLDLSDRSFSPFWLPGQDVTAHNHAAQWASATYAKPAGDGGTCGHTGDACSAQVLCCGDNVCCGGSCAETCVR